VKKLNKKIAQSANVMTAIHNEANAVYSDKRYVGYRQGYSVATKSISSEFDMTMSLEGKRYNLVMRIWNSENIRNRGNGIESGIDYGVALDPGEFYPELEGEPMYLEVEKSDGTQDSLFLPADPSAADSIMANVDYALILVKPELTEEEWLQIKQERTNALLDWYDSTSVLRTWVCAGLEDDQNRGVPGCGGGVPVPPLEPGGKWLRLVSFSSVNNEWGEDEIELFATSKGDVYPPNALSRFLVPGGGNYTVNRTLTALNPISNLRIRAIEDDCEPLRLKIGSNWFEKTWAQVRDFIIFAPNPESLTDNFLGARLNIQQVGFQLAKQAAKLIWDEVRRKRGEISTAAGIDFATFDFDDRSVKNVFEAMAHYGGCFNSDDGLRSNTINITISNLERDMVTGGGVASTTGTSREVNFVFKLQNTFD
jgi:hypothetical protein